MAPRAEALEAPRPADSGRRMRRGHARLVPRSTTAPGRPCRPRGMPLQARAQPRRTLGPRRCEAHHTGGPAGRRRAGCDPRVRGATGDHVGRTRPRRTAVRRARRGAGQALRAPATRARVPRAQATPSCGASDTTRALLRVDAPPARVGGRGRREGHREGGGPRPKSRHARAAGRGAGGAGRARSAWGLRARRSLPRAPDGSVAEQTPGKRRT